MAYIGLTLLNDGGPVYINSDYVVAVYQDYGVVDRECAMVDVGTSRFTVDESVEEVIKLLARA